MMTQLQNDWNYGAKNATQLSAMKYYADKYFDRQTQKKNSRQH
jgi:hypothetical protein